MKQLNLSHMFTKCNTCLLNNYNVDLALPNINTSSDIEDANGDEMPLMPVMPADISVVLSTVPLTGITGNEIQIYCDKICASHTV